MDKAEKIMAILNDELNKEIECYGISKELLNKSRNPIKRIRNKKGLEMFGHHVAALEAAIKRIKRETK